MVVDIKLLPNHSKRLLETLELEGIQNSDRRITNIEDISSPE